MQVTECRVCKQDKLVKFLSLGDSPLANNLLHRKDEPFETYPLELMLCENCYNCQLSVVVPPEKMFDTYLYQSSTTKKFQEHFEEAADKYIKLFALNEKSLVVDVGSNDGIALFPFQKKNIPVLGIDPAENIVEIARQRGIPTLHSYFNNKITNTILDSYGQADIVMASNVFAHSDNIEEITNSAFKILKQNGSFIIEVQYLVDTIKDLTFDNIYHEHVNYWTVSSLVNFFYRLGYTVYNVEHINTHGGSIRVYVHRSASITKTVGEFVLYEQLSGMNQLSTYTKFASDIEETKTNLRNNINNLISAESMDKTIVGYGAPAKATTAINYYGLTEDHIPFVIEDNKLKQSKYIPTVFRPIPILSKDRIFRDILLGVDPKNVIILVLAWNFYDNIIEQNKHLIDRGYKFVNIKDLL